MENTQIKETSASLECKKLKEEVKIAKNEMWEYIRFISYPTLMFLLILFSDKEECDLRSLSLLVVWLSIWLGTELRDIILKNK
jgi:hypothetical protein